MCRVLEQEKLGLCLARVSSPPRVKWEKGPREARTLVLSWMVNKAAEKSEQISWLCMLTVQIRKRIALLSGWLFSPRSCGGLRGVITKDNISIRWLAGPREFHLKAVCCVPQASQPGEPGGLSCYCCTCSASVPCATLGTVPRDEVDHYRGHTRLFHIFELCHVVSRQYMSHLRVGEEHRCPGLDTSQMLTQEPALCLLAGWLRTRGNGNGKNLTELSRALYSLDPEEWVRHMFSQVSHFYFLFNFPNRIGNSLLSLSLVAYFIHFDFPNQN